MHSVVKWILLAAAPLAAQPVINTSGVLNAASYSLPGLPNSPIAPGSLFIVFGKNLGPSTLVSASYPLPALLSGTSASVTVNGTTLAAIMVYTSATQVAMVLPSATPVGTGIITLTYNGQPSAPAPVQVAATGFGIFTLNQAGSGPAVITDGSYAYITQTHSANPGQTVALWGTGLGSITAAENQPPPQGNLGTKPTVWVGTQQASVAYWGRAGCCAGLDQINFQVPTGVTGCYVPVAVQIGNTISNYTSIAVAPGSLCSDAAGLGSSQLLSLQAGQSLNIATLSLLRSTLTLSPPAPAASTTTTADSASATFLRYTPALWGATSFSQAVSPGGCMVFPLISATGVVDPVQPLGLDAGSHLTLGGIIGTASLSAQSTGNYSANLGSSTSPPLFLDANPHTFNISGGADVSAFTQEVPMPPALAWSNQSSISAVSESAGVTVNWTNAAPSGFVTVTGSSYVPDANGNFLSGASFRCVVRSGSGSGQLTIPPAVLMSLPVSTNSATATGFLGIRSQTAPQQFAVVHGLDTGFASASVQIVKNVTYGQ